VTVKNINTAWFIAYHMTKITKIPNKYHCTECCHQVGSTDASHSDALGSNLEREMGYNEWDFMWSSSALHKNFEITPKKKNTAI
jgi:hypothetical protein